MLLTYELVVVFARMNKILALLFLRRDNYYYGQFYDSLSVVYTQWISHFIILSK